MSISGVSSSSTYLASASLRVHGAGCACTQCTAARVETSPAPADIAAQEGNTQLARGAKKLSPEELEQVQKLQARDREVRQHEQAHMAAAGGLAISAPSFSYQRGADGVSYAIGGEVSIDVSPGRSPQETLTKAQIVERAALAPKDPSGADRAVAAQARQMALEAAAQLSQHGQDGKTAEADTGSHADDSRTTSPNQRAQKAYGSQQANNAYSLISAYA